MQYFELQLACGHYYAVAAVDRVQQERVLNEGMPGETKVIDWVPYTPDYTKIGIGDHHCRCGGDNAVVGQTKTPGPSRRHGLAVQKQARPADPQS